MLLVALGGKKKAFNNDVYPNNGYVMNVHIIFVRNKAALNTVSLNFTAPAEAVGEKSRTKIDLLAAF